MPNFASLLIGNKIFKDFSMDWINDLLWGEGIGHSILLLSFVIAAGIQLGKIKVFGISLGITLVLFVGTMKAILYDDVPNHTRTFIERAKRGDFNGTLFTRVLPEFMIQGGAPDSKNAPAGAKCGFGDHFAQFLDLYHDEISL